jgi:cytochrome c peroxidase
MRTIIICLSIGLLLGLGAVAARAQEPITPVMMPAELDPAKVALGRQLFFDPRLSKSGFISCNSCHNLSMGGTDNLPTSIGHGWNQGPINAPTVLNASFNLAQFWDGRAEDLQAQAGGPIANPGEMASTHTLAIDVLQSIPGYVTDFEQAFGSPGIDIERVTAAIAEFEETLVTPNSRFDQWLLGDAKALTAQEQAGYALFKSTGCTSCHRGAAVGGETYMKFGIVSPYETANEAHGRIAVTGQANDRDVFKVPTLRNIELTYPYFHDGAVKTLEEAVDIMARLQLGRDLKDEEVGNIVAFLKTLTGEQPSFPLPILPPSTAHTPTPAPFN